MGSSPSQSGARGSQSHASGNSSKYCLQRREITYRENPVNKWLFLLNKFLLEKTNLSLGSFLRCWMRTVQIKQIVCTQVLHNLFFLLNQINFIVK
jgi:hypothetical protein